MTDATTTIWDVLIVGGGPAGVAAAIYSSRSLLKTLIIEKGMIGGNVANTERVDNYPGFPGGLEAFELSSRFKDHATEFGAEIKNAEVSGVRVEGGMKILQTDAGEIKGKALIVAPGLAPARLGVPGEDKFWGRGVSACATCDGPFYKDAKVAVVGGGNSAVEEALYLTKFAKEVCIVHRRDQLRAARIYQEKAFANPKISFRWNCIVKSIFGSETVEGVELENVLTHETRKLDVEGVFIYIGHKPMAEWLGSAVDKNSKGFIKIDSDMQTNVPGIFAAGDVVNPKYRQIVIAAGEGARAALAAEKYLNEKWGS